MSMKKSIEDIFKEAMGGEKPSIYFQLDIKGADKLIQEKVDGMMGVTFKQDGNKEEINAIMAMPPSVEHIEKGMESLAQAVTMLMLKATSADPEDVAKLLMGAMQKGIAKGIHELMDDDDKAMLAASMLYSLLKDLKKEGK
jgi:hypothetical protein